MNKCEEYKTKVSPAYAVNFNIGPIRIHLRPSIPRNVVCLMCLGILNQIKEIFQL